MENKADKSFNGVTVPAGDKIQFVDGKPIVPNHPIVPYIEGDGIGPEIWAASRKILEAAILRAYGSDRSINWYEIFAGDKAVSKFGKPLPKDSLDAIAEFGVAIKGPLGTPTGGGMRSLNVTMRQHFDLYRCIRPVRYFPGVPSVVVAPQDLNVVIFRENIEDVYAGIEYRAESDEAKKVIELVASFGTKIRDDSGIGIKIMSKFGSERLVRRAIQYAIDSGRKVVTLVHKGNIQKFTEGAFRDWGFDMAKAEFRDHIVTEDELWAEPYNGKMPDGKILLNSRIADAMFFEVLTRPTEFSVIATTNLNGDYLSDACAAQVGGLGIAPGANIGDLCAIFEATHGTAPRIAGKNVANPSSLLLSGVMMLEFFGWTEAGKIVSEALEKTIAARTCTGDLAQLMKKSKTLSTSEFADAVVANMPELKVEEKLVAVVETTADAPKAAAGSDAAAVVPATEPATTATESVQDEGGDAAKK